jgi:hypothetical protein
VRDFDEEQLLVVSLSIDAVIDLIRTTRDRVATKKRPRRSGHEEVASYLVEVDTNLGLEL